MYKDIFEELAFKFSNLADLKPDNIKTNFDFLSFALKDETVHNFNPSRYVFYIEFMKGLKDPDLLKNIIYENKLIKGSKEEENKTIEEIVKKMNLLYSISGVTTNPNILKDDELYTRLKKELRKTENAELEKRIKNILNIQNDDVNDEIHRLLTEETKEKESDKRDQKSKKREEELKKKIEQLEQQRLEKQQLEQQQLEKQQLEQQQLEKQQLEKLEQQQLEKQQLEKLEQQQLEKQQQGGAEEDSSKFEPKNAMDELAKNAALIASKVDNVQNDNNDDTEKMKKNFKLIRENFKKNSHLYDFKNKLKYVLDTPSVDSKVKASKLRDIIIEIEEDDLTSINSLKLTKEDKLVFIGITFLLRLISLMIIEWALHTNFCVTFTQAYLLWLGLYSIFLLICIVIVNITYNYPIFKLYEGSHSLYTSIASAFYYFYFIPGNFLSSSLRIVIHFGVIIFLTIIAILIVDQNNNSITLNYDYAHKKKIIRSIGDFTLILWLFTSIIAMYVS